MRALSTLCLTAICGCAVVHPPGWPGRDVEPEVLVATPLVMYGFAPTSWDLPDGRRIRIDVDQCMVGSALGRSLTDIDFSVAFHDAPAERIRCRTDPSGVGVPETRFGCSTEEGAERPMQLWMAPGQECDAGSPGTLTRSECWHGELATGGGPISLVHGYLESTGSPVGYVSWVSRDGPLLAANIVVDQQIRVYDVGADLPAELRDRLLLLTVALSFWEHASQPD